MTIGRYLLAGASLLLFVCNPTSAGTPSRDGVMVSGSLLVAVEGPADKIAALGQPGGIQRPAVKILGKDWNPSVFLTISNQKSSTQLTSSWRAWVRLAPPPNVKRAAPGSESPWDAVHKLIEDPRSLVEYLQEDGLEICEIEPDVIMVDPRAARYSEKAVSRSSGAGECREVSDTVSLCSGPSRHWPGGAPGWHLGDEYSQLRLAREQASHAFDRGQSPVRIAHLDTGYNPAFKPDRLDARPGNNLVERGDLPFDHLSQTGLFPFPGHGPSTLSVLAGPQVALPDYTGRRFEEPLGGAPRAVVVPFRIGTSVIHIFPRTMAEAIAAASEQAELISMSNGGTPSGALRDAVNAAYLSGCAMFFASGDFFQLPLIGLRTPHSTVYPARFSRTVAVTGVTAAGKTYAYAPSRWSWIHGDVMSWMTRGSYGPASVMRHAIAAYTPNVTKNMMRDCPDQRVCFGLSFAGTSAATPQVAATAALWLQVNRCELERLGYWRSWRQAEAVYDALFNAAAPGATQDYTFDYFGRGVLQARDTLHQPVPASLQQQDPATIGFDWLSLISGTWDDEGPQRRDNLRLKAFRMEVAQLVNSSSRLQATVGELAEATASQAEQSAEEVTSVVRLLRSDRRASRALRSALRGWQNGRRGGESAR